MKRYLFCLLLMLIAALMAVGCKARKVLNTHTDSVVKTNEAKNTSIKVASVDTGKKITNKIVLTQDSAGFKVTITPVPGKPIKVNNDGSFTGEASNVEIIGHKKTNTRSDEKTTEQKGTSHTKSVDSTTTKKQEQHVQKKIKNISTKPDYSWIWWTAGAMIMLFIAWNIYKKFVL